MFNSEVFEKSEKFLTNKDIDNMDKFMKVLHKCERNNIDYYILSNSPYEWIKHVMSKSILNSHFNEKNVYCA